MAILLDDATRAGYIAQTLASSRASLVVSALSGTVVVEVFDGLNVLRASGTMAAPWATVSGATITIGEVNAAGLSVTSGGTPTADWYCQFRAGTRFVRGTFGVAGSSRDFRWSLPTFETGSRGTLGTVTLTAAGVTGLAPTNTSPPTISGTPQVGAVLSGTDGTWTSSPASYEYRWQRADTDAGAGVVDISGTTGVRIPDASDATKYIRRGVRALNDAGASSWAYSGWTGPVASAAATGSFSTTITLQGGSGSVPYTLGHVFKQGDVPSGHYLAASSGTLQADIRNRWPDGSIKYAVLSGVATAGSTITLSRVAGTAPVGAVAEPIVEAIVAFSSVTNAAGTTIGSGAFSASLAAARANGAQSWSRTLAHRVRRIDGPVMSEFHYYAPVLDGATSTPEAHLAVWFFVRAYANGAVEIETVVENGWAQVASPGRRNYVATVTVAGTQRYTTGALINATITLPILSRTTSAFFTNTDTRDKFPVNSRFYVNGDTGTLYTVIAASYSGLSEQTTYTVSPATLPAINSIQFVGHPHHARWSRVDWVGTDPGVTALPSVAYLAATSLVVPSPVSTLDAVAYTSKPDAGPKYATWTKTLADTIGPLTSGNIDPSLGAGGDSDNYGLIPVWDAVYFVEGDVRARHAIAGNARALGRFGLHYRDETTGRPLRPSQYLSLGIIDTHAGLGDNAGNNPSLTPPPSGGYNQNYAYSHGPSIGFTEYMLSGRWSALESMWFTTATGVMRLSGNAHNGYRITQYWEQPRTHAWMLRNMAQASSLSPETLAGAPPPLADTAMRAEMIGMRDADIDYYHGSFVSTAYSGPPALYRQNAFGIWRQIGDYGDYKNTANDGQHEIGCFMAAFNTMAVCYAYLIAEAPNTKLRELAEFTARFPIGLFGGIGTKWDYRVSSFYQMAFATGDQDAMTFRASWDAQWDFLTTYYQWSPSSPFPLPTDKVLRNFSPENVSPYDMVMSSSTQFGNGTAGSSVRGAVALACLASRKAAIESGSGFTGAERAHSNFANSTTYANSIAPGGYWRTEPYFAFSASFTPPYALPATGQVVTIGANTFNSVKPVEWSNTVFNESVFNSFGGGTFVPEYSVAGAWVAAGTGGHGHAEFTGGVIFDFADARWKLRRAADPNALLLSGYVGGGPAYQLADCNGAPYFEINGTNQVPTPAHPYGRLQQLPRAFGGGVKGSVVYVGRAAVTGSAEDSPKLHAFDLDTGVWSRYSATTIRGTDLTSGDALWDEARSRWWHFLNSENAVQTLHYVDATDRLAKNTASFGGSIFGIGEEARSFLHSGHIVRTNGTRVYVINPDSPTGGWATPTMSYGSGLTTLGIGPSNRFVPYKGKFWCISTAGGNQLARLTPPAGNPMTGTWTVDLVTIPVSIPGRSGYTSHDNSLVYVPAIDCLAWIQGGDSPVYLIRPE